MNSLCHVTAGTFHLDCYSEKRTSALRAGEMIL